MMMTTTMKILLWTQSCWSAQIQIDSVNQIHQILASSGHQIQDPWEKHIQIQQKIQIHRVSTQTQMLMWISQTQFKSFFL